MIAPVPKDRYERGKTTIFKGYTLINENEISKYFEPVDSAKNNDVPAQAAKPKRAKKKKPAKTEPTPGID